jgi:hypothetical protein
MQLFGLNIVYSDSRFMSLTQKVFTNVLGRGGISQRFRSLLIFMTAMNIQNLEETLPTLLR